MVPTENQGVRQTQEVCNPHPTDIDSDRLRTDEVSEETDLIMQEYEQGMTNTGILSRNKTQEKLTPTVESDRSSLMQWSPVKLVGNKRTLEVIGEADDSSSSESEEEREEGELSDEEELAGSDAESQPESPTPGDGLERTSTHLAEGATPEMLGPTEQHVNRGREHSFSNSEIAAAHLGNTDSGDTTAGRYQSPPKEQSSPKQLGHNHTNLASSNELEQPREVAPTAADNRGEEERLRERDQGMGAPGRPSEVTHSRSLTNPTHTRHDKLTGGKTGTVTVEGTRERPSALSNGHLNSKPNQEENKGTEAGVTRPTEGGPNANRVGPTLSNQARLPNEISTQPGEAEEGAVRTGGMTEGGRETIIRDTNPTAYAAPPEVICETQCYQNARNRGKLYNEIMASIGLDSPTSSLEERTREDTTTYDQESGSPLATTPIRNSTANLLALGKHVLTPRHGRVWEFKGKSPLGG
jgi:hypothetical protein